MSDIRQRFANLSPEQRKLALKKLQQKGLIASKSRNGFSTHPITPVERRDNLPLSFAQHRLWFLDQLEPGRPTYNIPTAIRLTGQLNIDAWRQALDALVRRHESLRTTFAQTETGQPIQVIHDTLPFDWRLVDLRSLPLVQRETAVSQLTTEEASRPFDLSTGPLLRSGLLQLGDEEYVILLTMHHIISDGWSTSILIRDLAAFYDAFVHDKPVPLPHLPIQYADYAAWQQAWLAGETMTKQLAYWQKKLAGAPAVLALPTDRPRPAVQTFRGATATFYLSPQLSEQLRAFSRQEGVTLFTLLLTAFQVLLSRYSGQTDIVVGSPIAGRNRAEIEGLIGFFVNTLVLRSHLSGNPTFHTLLQQVRETVLDAQAHQDIPFEKLVETLKPDRNLSHSPLFQVMFALQDAPIRGLELPQVTLKPILSDSGVSRFDMTLSMTETARGLMGSLEYSTDLFDEATIERFMGHFQVLLTAVLTDAHQPVATLPLLTAPEQTQLLITWNDTQAPSPVHPCAHDLFEAQAARTPQATAVLFDSQQLTYAQLNSRANQLAHFLHKRGIGPGDLVGLCLERSLEMIIGVWGTLKAGAAYVPLDPTYPPERLAFMVQDAQLALLLTREGLRPFINELPTPTPPLLCLDSEWPLMAQESQQNLSLPLSGENLAYVIYTSGSTGNPKGVLVSHRGMPNLSQAQGQMFGLTPADRVLQFASFSFDAATFEICMALLQGAALCMAPRERLLPGEALFQFLHEQHISVVTLSPSALAALPLKPLPDLRVITVAGEVCPATLVADWHHGRSFFNLYGPTEATIWATAAACTDPEQLPPIGHPIANTQTYILDPHLQPVPVGAPGELHISGIGLAQGYLQRFGLTADRFIPHPFSQEPGQRLYKTGDLARYLPDGTIEFLGRIDNQVKIRGFRIELGEIEAVLARHSAVHECVVTASTNKSGDKQLIAYTTLHPDQQLTSSQLRAHLKASLPDYMIPALFMTLEKLPLTPNGKVDRKALPLPDVTRPDLASTFAPPQTPPQQELAAIWRQLLDVEQVGIDDDFFELGGHSLLVTQLIAQIRQAFGVELPVRQLFESTTVAALTAQIEQAQAMETKPTGLALQPVSRESDLPLSFAQQRLWFLESLEPDLAAYHIPLVLQIKGVFQLAAWQAALTDLIARHETLRTTFAQTEQGDPIQIIAPTRPLTWDVHDVRHLPSGSRDSQAEALIQQAAQRPFDLAQGPLLRVCLVQVADEETIIGLTMHHIISDGWSMGIFIQELAALYRSHTTRQTVPLPSLPLQYADFAVCQRQWLQSESGSEQMAYWQVQLAAVPEVLALPTDYPRPPVQTFRGASYAFTLPADTMQTLQQISRAGEATLFMTLLAAFQTLLARYSGQEEVVVGSPVANRRYGEVQHLIGFFVNTLVLRTDLSGDPTFGELLQRVREVVLGAQAHQDIPFEQLVELVQPERDMRYSPLFQVMFAYLPAPVTPIDLPGLTITPLPIESETAKFDLTLSITGHQAQLEYNTDLFAPGTIQRLIGHFCQLLQAIAADPDQHLSQLSLLTEAERVQLITTWNDTAAPYLQGVCLHEAFAQWAAREPLTTAVVANGRSLTYEQLNQQANQLAHYLQQMGVERETPVGIYMQPSIDMITAVLGILKAGGTYVPLDPAYPQERLTYILNDAQISILLTANNLPRIQHPAYTICLDKHRNAIAYQNKENPVSGVTPNHLAYLIYTSGSTGQAKGVGCGHAGVLNLLAHFNRYQPIGVGHNVTLWTSLSFDVSVYDIFSALVMGAALHIVPEEVRPDTTLMLDWLVAHEIHSCYLPPFMLAEMAAWLAQDHTPPPLQRLLVGVEPIPESVLAAISRALPDLEVINGYGPTEATICCTLYPVSADSARSGRTPLGRPVQNLAVYLLDGHLRPVPVGLPGELYVGGVSLARGYVARPALTADRFIPHPFSQEPDARLYRTGDVVRYLPDGNLLFLGRSDYQVKVRGYRIELGEIETVLRQHTAVQETAVLVREDTPGDKRIVAYVVPTEVGAPLPITQLRAFLQEKLPPYMLPAAFVGLDDLPQTPNGKLDRRALPVPTLDDFERQVDFVAPRSPLEETIAAMWADLLQVERVGVYDNFFGLGGHSLLATRLIVRISQALSVPLSMRQLFESPTVAALARQIEQAQAERLPTAPSQPIQRDSLLPLSFAQQRLWFLEMWQPHSANYNIPIALRLTGQLDVLALQQSLADLVARHEILRTTFAQTSDGTPVQVIAPAQPINWDTFDLRHLPEPSRDTKATALLHQAAQRPFDLEQGPLLRACLIQLADTDTIVGLTMHHIISDGWSTNILIQELTILYISHTTGRPAALPVLPIQYADFAARQRTWLQSEMMRRQLAYWQEQLAAVPNLLALPTDYPRPAVQTYNGASERFTLPSTLVQALQQISQAEGATLFMTLLAAFQVLLYRYSRQEDIVVGTPIASRHHNQVEHLIGLFVNTLVLRTDLSGDPTFSELLQRVRQVVQGAQAYQDVPFEQLVELVQPNRDMSHSPLFQVMLAYQPDQPAMIDLPDLTVQPLPIENETAKFDLTLSLTQNRSQLSGVLEYNTDLFAPETAQRMLTHLHRLLTAVAANPAQRLRDLPLLTAVERETLLHIWHNDQPPPPPLPCYPHLFETQVAQTPPAPALLVDDQSLTYAELNQRANQLAHHLRAKGVQPGVCVAVYLERSLDLVISLLAIFKAGGVYVPLDPAYPTAHLVFVLADTHAPLLLTHQAVWAERPSFTLPPHCTPLYLDTGWPTHHSLSNPAPVVTAADLAYIIYTSGSTGQPKGVMISHEALSYHCTTVQAHYELTAQDKVLQFASFSFDASLEQLLPSLLTGAQVVVRGADLPDTASFYEQVTRLPLTVINLPTAYWSQLTQDWQRVAAWLAQEQVRLLIVGGEAMLSFPYQPWQAAELEHVRVLNAYGPTEATITAVVHDVLPLKGRPDRIPIGRPLAHRQVYILDQRGEPVPIGVVGELCLGGAGLARGYLKRPGLTAAAFIPHPFSPEPGQCLYRTGDLARYLPDGTIEFIGRADHQVKIRGFRIELGEIETALNQHPAVGDTAVITTAESATANDKRLVAYFTLKTEAPPPTTSDLRRFLQGSLPTHMIPAIFIPLAEMPLAPNGKVNRRALPQPDQSRPDLAQAFVPPQTPTEKVIAAVWMDLLNLEQIGVHDNFFELGGHSLLVIRCLSRLNEALNMTLPLRRFFETPTVAGLAQSIETIQWATQTTSAADDSSDDEVYEEGEL